MWIIIFILTVFINCSSSSNIETFTWLTGTWEMRKKDKSSRLEVWKMNPDQSLTGQGLKVAGKDTAILETIQLAYFDEQYWYIPTVPDQNNALPVGFKLISSEGLKFVFENSRHDYPQRIIYHYKPLIVSNESILSKGDELMVRVEKMDGTEAITFPFVRK